MSQPVVGRIAFAGRGNEVPHAQLTFFSKEDMSNTERHAPSEAR
jgi:hypothetical protein